MPAATANRPMGHTLLPLPYPQDIPLPPSPSETFPPPPPPQMDPKTVAELKTTVVAGGGPPLPIEEERNPFGSPSLLLRKNTFHPTILFFPQTKPRTGGAASNDDARTTCTANRGALQHFIVVSNERITNAWFTVTQNLSSCLKVYHTVSEVPDFVIGMVNCCLLQMLKSKEECLPIVILFVNKEQLIAVPRLESSSGSRQVQAVWNTIVDWNLEHKCYKENLTLHLTDSEIDHLLELYRTELTKEIARDDFRELIELSKNIYDFISVRSNRRSIVLKLMTVFSTNSSDESFQEARKKVSTLRAVNDTAERAVKLMQDFHGLITGTSGRIFLERSMEFALAAPASTKTSLGTELRFLFAKLNV
ncbi:hypothetical protein J437_LFUL016157 [Ladona fulva]|uniref:Uncharacterized protein n=1 Tax=Ladona fulva TaxID=123851 RepID=A0A8K0P7P9_LADFU|nr:hypothetical protein J437_LFUL016157 [Ladona fulva]